MATCDQSKCSTVESEQTGYVCCSLCLEDGSRTTARHYCVDCEVYYCGKCVKYHNKIPSTKSHQVNDIESPDSPIVADDIKGNLSTETEKCKIHDGKLIDTHCKDHDEVCCGICAAVKHRLCATESIDEAAKYFNPNPKVNKSKEAMSKVLTQLQHEKDKRMESKEDISHQKMEKLIEAVDKHEERIIKKVKQLANTSRREIRSTYKEHTTSLDIDVQALDVVMTTITEYLDKLKLPGNEPNLFVTVKSSEMVTREGERLLQEMVKEWNRKLIFHFDETLENTIDGMKALGSCTIKEYKTTLQKTVNMQTSYTKQHTALDIFQKRKDLDSSEDMCLMDSGDLLLTEFNTCIIKRFDSNLLFKDEIRVQGSPVAVCKIDEHEVAVRLSYPKMVQFVSVGQHMKTTSSIKLDGDRYGMAYGGNGMAYDADTKAIFACENDKVSVYSKTGSKLRTYDEDTNGKRMFFHCRRIALSMNKKDIYVTDKTGLTILDIGGHLKMKVPLSGIKGPRPVCVLPGHFCLMGCQSSGVIVQVDKHGKQIGKLIDATEADERTSTYGAAYDHKHSNLIVWGYPGVISVYSLSPKII